MTDPADDGRGELNAEERAAFKRRSAELAEKLGKVRDQEAAEVKRVTAANAQGRGMAYGFRMASEFVAAIVVGGLLGFGLDWLIGTGPWLFLAFFMLGFVAGVMNVLRAYQRLQGEITAQTGGRIGQSVRDDDDD